MKQPTQPSVTKRLLDAMNMIIASDFEPDIQTQADFADAIGVHPTAISSMMAGRRHVTVEQLVMLCTRFKVSGTYLLLGKGDMFMPGSRIDSSAAKIESRLRDLVEKMDVLIAASHNQKPGTETRNKTTKLSKYG